MTEKKNLKKKTVSSSSVLVQLFANKKLVCKVDNMLDEEQPYDFIIEFCKENGLSISKASLTNYKKKREESIRTGTPLIQLLDKRAKDKVTYITDKQVETFKESMQEQEQEEEVEVGEQPKAKVHDISKIDKVYNDLEFLDEVISKGMKGLKQFDVVDTPTAMKAIELKAKLTNNQLSGLSIAGLRELKIRMACKEASMMEVIMKYVPEEQHEALFADMDAAEKAFYENLDLTEEDKRISKALENSGLGDF